MAKASDNPAQPTVEFEAPQAPAPVEEPKTEAFPVKLNKNYRPQGVFKVLVPTVPGDEFSPREPRDPLPEELYKVPAGTIILLPVEEAKQVMKINPASGLRIAERADELKL